MSRVWFLVYAFTLSSSMANSAKHPTDTPSYPTRRPYGAPIAMDVAVDLECPFTADYLSETLPRLQARFPDKIQVRIHQAPMEFHPIAKRAAEAALCAHEQGYYWEFQDAILKAQWGKLPRNTRRSGAAKKELTPAQVLAVGTSFAKELPTDPQRPGFSVAKFENCMGLSETSQRVEKQKAEMSTRGMTGVPSTFIGEVQVSGNNPEKLLELVRTEMGEK